MISTATITPYHVLLLALISPAALITHPPMINYHITKGAAHVIEPPSLPSAVLSLIR
jgi:hypothetical protein